MRPVVSGTQYVRGAQAFRIVLFAFFVFFTFTLVVILLSLVGLISLTVLPWSGFILASVVAAGAVILTIIVGSRNHLLDQAREYGPGWVFFWRNPPKRDSPP